MFPSLCELAGIEAPDYLQGESFVPLMRNPNQQWKKAAFSQFHRRPKVTPDGGRYMGYSVRTLEHHYIEWYEWNNETKERGKFVDVELYSLVTDPDENENLSRQSDNTTKELLIELSKTLNAGWQEAKPSI